LGTAIRDEHKGQVVGASATFVSRWGGPTWGSSGASWAIPAGPRAESRPPAIFLCIHCVPKKRPPFYFSNNSVKN